MQQAPTCSSGWDCLVPCGRMPSAAIQACSAACQHQQLAAQCTGEACLGPMASSKAGLSGLDVQTLRITMTLG